MEWNIITCFLARNEHKDMLSSFGLAKDGNFPTAAFVPAKIDNDSKVRGTKNYYIVHLVDWRVLCLNVKLKIILKNVVPKTIQTY